MFQYFWNILYNKCIYLVKIFFFNFKINIFNGFFFKFDKFDKYSVYKISVYLLEIMN